MKAKCRIEKGEKIVLMTVVFSLKNCCWAALKKMSMAFPDMGMACTSGFKVTSMKECGGWV
jgi:hypothetical protein